MESWIKSYRIKMKELVGIILLTVLVVFGSCNSNTNVSLVGTSPQLFGVRQVSSGNPGYRNRELFINKLEKKCKYPIEFQKNNLEAYVAVEYTTDQRGYIVKKKVVACDKKIHPPLRTNFKVCSSFHRGLGSIPYLLYLGQFHPMARAPRLGGGRLEVSGIEDGSSI